MTQADIARSLWMSHGNSAPARERLRKSVAALTRARHRQVLLDHGCGGLLAGLVFATVAVLVVRLLALPYPLWPVAGAVVGFALTAALLLGWRKRPDTLDVAVRADLTLRLKQRLSTAWEIQRVQGDSALFDRLASQAVRAGLAQRPEQVFPLRVGRWGRLAPLAATALLLVSVLDLDWLQAPVTPAVDERVTREGLHVGAFGRAMLARAQRDKLPRSSTQAAHIERLGARMESGELSRAEALAQLRQVGESLAAERRQALADANPANISALRGGGEDSPPGNAGVSPAAMLERMQRGVLDSADTRALSGQLDNLERALGIPRSKLEQALRQHQAGDPQELRQMLEQLAQIERTRKDEKELRNAQQQVRRVRENLGASPTVADAGRDALVDTDDAEDKDHGSKSGDGNDDSHDGHDGHDSAKAAVRGSLNGEAALAQASTGSQAGSSAASERQPSPLAPEPQSQPLVQAPSQSRTGEVFVSQARMLPRAGQQRVDSVELSSEYASQMEAVLSKEEYPAHYKAFVRRYFLSLSQGPQQPPSAKRGAP